MTAETKLSAKGQVVIPKDVRDRLGLVEGMVLQVIAAGDDIVLRKPRDRGGKLTIEQATAELRKLYQHKGPPIPIERLSWPGDYYEEGCRPKQRRN